MQDVSLYWKLYFEGNFADFEQYRDFKQSCQEIGKKRKKGRPAKEPGFHKRKPFYKKRKQ